MNGEDRRPANCRQRMLDEGAGAVPRSCPACGLLRKCPQADAAPAPPPPASPLVVTHEPEEGLVYVHLAGGQPPAAARTVRVPGVPGRSRIFLDFDEDGRLVGIEMVGDAALHPALRAVAVPPGGAK